MAMNVGLGFLFKASANGMTKALNLASRGIAGIGEKLKKVGELGKSDSLRNVIDGLQLNTLTDIKNKLDPVTGMENSISRLTSTLEQYGTDVDAAFSKVAVGLNLNAKETKRWKAIVGSAAKSTNTDIGTAVRAFESLTQSQIDLKKIGVKNFEQWLKIVNVADLDAGKFGTTLGQLQNEFGLSGEQIKGLLDDYAQIGKSTNLGTKSLGAMSDQLDTLRPILLSTLKTKGPEAVATMLRSTQALAGVMQDAFGGDPQENMAAALKMTQKIAESNFELNKAFVGLGDVPEFQIALAQNFGSMAEAQELLQKDTTGFMMKLRAMNKEMASKNPQLAATFMERMAVQLGEIDPKLALVFKGGEKVDQVMHKLGDPSKGSINNAAGAMQRMTKGFRDGRTVADRMQMSMERFDQKIRDIEGRKMDALVQKKLIPAIDDFGNELVAVAKEDGPMGFMVRKLSQFQKVGGAAFLPLDTEWGQKVFILGKLVGASADKFEPMLDTFYKVVSVAPILLGAIGSVGSVFVTMAGWLLTAGTAIGGVISGWIIPFFFQMTASGQALSVVLFALYTPLATAAVLIGSVGAVLGGLFFLGTDAGGKFADSVSKAFGSLLKTLAGWATKAADIMNGWAQGLVDYMETHDIATEVSTTIQKGMERLVAMFSGGGESGPFGKAMLKLGEALLNLLSAGLVAAWEALPGALWEVTKRLASWAIANWPTVLGYALGGPIGAAIGWVAQKYLFPKLGEWTDMFLAWAKAVPGRIWEWTKKNWPTILAGAIGGPLGLAFALSWPMVEPMLKNLAKSLLGGLYEPIAEAMSGARKCISELWDYVWSIFGNSVHEVIRKDFGQIIGIVSPIFKVLKALFSAFVGFISGDMDKWLFGLQHAWDLISDIGEGLMNRIMRGIERVIPKLGGVFNFFKGVAEKFGFSFSVSAEEQQKEMTNETKAAAEGRRQMMAAGGKSETQVMIGILSQGFEVLHKDLLDLKGGGGSKEGTKARPRPRSVDTDMISVAGNQ